MPLQDGLWQDPPTLCRMQGIFPKSPFFPMYKFLCQQKLMDATKSIQWFQHLFTSQNRFAWFLAPESFLCFLIRSSIYFKGFFNLESTILHILWTSSLSWSSLVAQTVKSLPAIQETWVRSLGQKDSPGEGNGNPLQYSCLENPMGRGAWQATYSPWGHKESDMTKQLHFIFSIIFS